MAVHTTPDKSSKKANNAGSENANQVISSEEGCGFTITIRAASGTDVDAKAAQKSGATLDAEAEKAPTDTATEIKAVEKTNTGCFACRKKDAKNVASNVKAPDGSAKPPNPEKQKEEAIPSDASASSPVAIEAHEKKLPPKGESTSPKIGDPPAAKAAPVIAETRHVKESALKDSAVTVKTPATSINVAAVPTYQDDTVPEDALLVDDFDPVFKVAKEENTKKKTKSETKLDEKEAMEMQKINAASKQALNKLKSSAVHQKVISAKRSLRPKFSA